MRVASCLRLAVAQAVATRYNVKRPPKIFVVWCFKTAISAPQPAMVIIETKNTFPARPCPGEPFRKDIAAAPDSNPTVPPLICRAKRGDIGTTSSSCPESGDSGFCAGPDRIAVSSSRPSSLGRGANRVYGEEGAKDARGHGILGATLSCARIITCGAEGARTLCFPGAHPALGTSVILGS